MNNTAITAIARPHRNLLKLYLIRTLLSGPFFFITLPILYFRYSTMRYNIDEEGISMKWGFLFRREINLTYARIQDIHLHSGVIQRWLGLADIHIQTASGSATAEMTIEGLLNYDEVRDFLYARMRGNTAQTPSSNVPQQAASADHGNTAELLNELITEIRGARQALERNTTHNGGERDV